MTKSEPVGIRITSRAMVFAAGILCLAQAAPVFGLGFRDPDQGARATGQGEAFVAQADDPSSDILQTRLVWCSWMARRSAGVVTHYFPMSS